MRELAKTSPMRIHLLLDLSRGASLSKCGGSAVYSGRVGCRGSGNREKWVLSTSSMD